MVESITDGRTFCHLETEYKSAHKQHIERQRVGVNSVVKDYLTTAL